MSIYYISTRGNDGADGLSETSAWKTINKVNTATLQPGDEVRFHSGDKFSGELLLHQSGSQKQPIIISSYGEGEKPILTGAIKATAWDTERNGQFSAKVAQPVHQLYFNDVQYDLARIPAKGFYAIESGDKNKLTDNQHLKLDYDLTGATLRIRAVNWQYETNRVAEHNDGTISFEESMMYQANPRYGYLLDNKYEFLTAGGQWFWDSKTHQLYLIPENILNPNEENVEVTVFKNGITISENVSHISIRNLKIEKYENAAVLGLGNSSHISVTDCNINDINVYGICLEINSGNYSIKNNTISDIRGRGISTLESCDNEIVGNTVARVGLYSGYGFDGVNNGIGIAVLKTEVTFKISSDTYSKLETTDLPKEILASIQSSVNLPYPDEKFVVELLELLLGKSKSGHLVSIEVSESVKKLNLSDKKIEYYISVIMLYVNAEAKAQKLESTNNRVAYNAVDKSGYAGIRLDGNNSIAECNVIKNSLLRMNDGGALYCWAQNENYTYNNIFRNNIIIDAIGSCEATANDLAYAYGIYTDNKCHHISIENNTVVGTVGGILINDEAHHMFINGNTLYDNKYGLNFSEYFMPDSLVGCETYNNILFAKKRDQRALFVECRIREKFVPGLFDRNLYVNPYYPFPIVEMTYKDNVRVFREFTLSAWQKHYGQDADSKMISTPNHDAGGQQSHIFINDSIEPKFYEIPYDLVYTDLDGKVLIGRVEVAPFSSFIILQK